MYPKKIITLFSKPLVISPTLQITLHDIGLIFFLSFSYSQHESLIECEMKEEEMKKFAPLVLLPHTRDRQKRESNYFFTPCCLNSAKSTHKHSHRKHKTELFNAV